MIARRHIVGLGLSQLICWGISFYLIGVLGPLIAADLGWSLQLVHGGFSISLLTMGFVSPFLGRLIDDIGGRRVMTIGSLLLAVACMMLSVAGSVATYFAAWIVMGVAMRCTLYDAAFATLARIAGPQARGPISRITLVGGLAATCFWPIGHFLAEALGWRGAVQVYAGFAVATVFIHAALPQGRYGDIVIAEEEPGASVGDRRGFRLRVLLFTLIVMLGNAFHTGMSSHMIGILTELGLGAGLAVTVASVRGIGQTTGRLVEVLSGSRLHPLDLNLVATTILPVSFVVGLASGVSVPAAFSFAFFYGVGTGLLTITRGTLPLVLFDSRSYGASVGKILVPSFIASAAAPYLYAIAIEALGAQAALIFSIGMLCVILAASILLKKLCLRACLKSS